MPKKMSCLNFYLMKNWKMKNWKMKTGMKNFVNLTSYFEKRTTKKMKTSLKNCLNWINLRKMN
jgi:hypothetical protein